MLNVLWLGLILASVLLGGFTGKLDAVTNGAFAAARDSVVSIALPLAGLMALWLGFLRLAELSGLVALLANALHPLLRRLFPDVPSGHPAMGAMLLNMAANALGLGNAATPLGLRAMRHLESLNPNPGTATNAMCTFLAINTSSIQLIPTTAVAILAAQGSKQSTVIVGTAFIATCISTLAGVSSVKLLERLKVFRLPATAPLSSQDNPPSPTPPPPTESTPPSSFTPPNELSARGRLLLLGLASCALFLAASMLFPASLEALLNALKSAVPSLSGLHLPPVPESVQSQTGISRVLNSISILSVPFLLAFFALYAALRGIKVYEEFLTGAKEGWEVAIRIIPPLVAILVGVKMFREAGGIQILANLLSPILDPLGVPTELLPMILVRPLSGGATTGLFTELVTQFGPDSLLARTAATIFGSTETTFYVLAVYFGSVSIQRGRHALAAGLIADVAGAAASIAICRWMFA
ncbi:MAG: nucleoside recognition domain-containing protein [Verrucomicrobiota bacterium]